MGGLQGERSHSTERYSQKTFADRKMFVTEQASHRPSGWPSIPEARTVSTGVLFRLLKENSLGSLLAAV